MVRKLDYSTVPDLDEEEQNLLVLVFISTPGFLANGTFPNVDTKKLANVANYSTAASANTAWYEVRKKLTALAKTNRPPTATVPMISIASPRSSVMNAVDTLLHPDPTITGTTSSAKKRARNTASLDRSEDGSEGEQTEAANDTKRRKISVKVAATDPGTPSTHTAPRVTRSATAKASSFANSETPLQPTLESKVAQAEEEIAGRSTYARHTRETVMAFGFIGELNILYDGPKEQENNFNEDFGGFDFND